jgi:hypothetical protein
MYKVIRCTGIVSLDTIQGPSFNENGSWEALAYFERYAKIFWRKISKKVVLDGSKCNKLPLTVKAGPNHSLAFFDAIYSLPAYIKHPDM